MAKKFSSKNFSKWLTKNILDITMGYISHGGKKDKRSNKITKTDMKKAEKMFEYDIKQKMKDNPHLTTIEAAKIVKRSNRFNIYADISKENMKKALEKFGINIRKSSLEYDETIGAYRIKAGKYAGKVVTTIHTPGSYPSYQLVLV